MKPTRFVDHNLLDSKCSLYVQFSSVTQSCPTLCDPMNCSMQSLCPSQIPRACSNSCPSSRWCHPTISSSVISSSSCLQFFSASASFPMSQFFTSGGQSIAASALASVLPMNIQDWFPLGWASLVAQLVKNPPTTRETWVQSLSWEDCLEKGTATHSSFLAWRIPWTV